MLHLMSRTTTILSRVLITGSIGAAVIGGVAVIPGPVSAAASAHYSVQAPIPGRIVGYYKTYSTCNSAGAKGVREGRWTNYVCYRVFDSAGWALEVETETFTTSAP